MRSRRFRPVVLSVSLLIAALLVSCISHTKITPTPKLEFGKWLSSPTQSVQAPPTKKNEATPLPVANEARVLVFTSKDNPPSVDESLRSTLSELAQQSHLSLVETGQISSQDLTADTRLIVLFSEPANLKDLLDAAPQKRFLALTESSQAGAPNLISLKKTNLRPDQVDFLAGFIAASSTKDWRMGVISLENTTSERAFTNGAVFFCGLCRPPFPPFEQYPLTATISGGAGNWQSAVDGMLAKGAELKTTYVAPGAESEALFTYLAGKDIQIISTQPMPQGLNDHWLVSLIQQDPSTSLKTMWASLISPDPATAIFPGAIFQNVNAAIFSSGRQRLAQNLIDDLENGVVSTGIQ